MRRAHLPCSGARRGQRGFAMVELALVLVPLILLLSGVAELGRAFYTYNILAQGVRNATRYLTLSNSPNNAMDQQKVRNLLRFGNVDGDGTLLVTGLQESMVKICTPTDTAACVGEDHSAVATGSGNVDLVSVRIDGFKYTPMLSAVFTTSVTFPTIGLTMRPRT